MGRDEIVDDGREANLKMYVWLVESMVECGGGDGGRELMIYPIGEVFLKKEPDHEDGLI